MRTARLHSSLQNGTTRGPASRRAWRVALAITLLLLLSLAPLAGAAVDPHPRAAPLATVGTVRAVAVAQNGVIVAATDDPGSITSTPDMAPADENTWYLWNAAGAGLQSGSSDLDNCAARLGDTCKTPAVAATVSGDGNRFAIGSNPADSLLDNPQGLLLAGKTAAGVTIRRPLDHPVQLVGMDRTGSKIVVVETVAKPTGQPDAIIEAFSFDGTALAVIGTAYTIPGAAVTGLAINELGTRYAVSADHPYRFLFGPTSPGIGSGLQGTALSTAIQTGGSSVSVAGMTTGEVALFNDTSPSLPMFSQKPSTSPVNAVAIQPTAEKPLIAAGDATGKVHLFRLDTSTSPAARLLKTVNVAGSAIVSAQFSSDGSTLLVRTASEIHLLQAAGDDLVLLWKDTQTTVGGGLSANGDLVAVAVGAGIRVYDAIHTLEVTPAKAEGLPGQSYDVAVAYKNTGTRNEDVSLEVAGPTGWNVTVTPATLTLTPGGTSTATLHVTVPSNARPGGAALTVKHTLATGGQGQTAVTFTVGAQVAVAIRADGPSSVAINAGGTVLLKARIENRGNQVLETAVRVATDPSGWTAGSSPQDLKVEPGQNKTVSVSLTAPANAKEGDRGEVKLYTTAKPDEVLHLYGTVGARFAVQVGSPPAIAVGPGNSTQVDITVQNKGNTVDSFDLQVLDLPIGWSAIFDQGGTLVQVADVAPNGQGHATLTLRAPADAVPGSKLTFQVQALSQGRPEVHAERQVQVVVGTAAEPTDTGSPAPGALLLLMAALGAALVARRGQASSRRRN